jgi:TPR repeat protein
MYTLAYIYLRNGSVFSNPTNDSPKIYDIDQYNAWYDKAEKNRKSLKDVNEDFSIGNMYYFGTHGMQDYDLSIKYHEKAAKQGNVLSMYTLATIYYFIKKDISNAQRWCQMRNDMSCIALSINIYMDNKNYDKISTLIDSWEEPFSQNKHIQHMIGKSFHSEKKYDKSVEWSIKAATPTSQTLHTNPNPQPSKIL